MTVCLARRSGTDEMHCASCRLRWDIDDPRPPQCLKTAHTVEASGFISGLAVDSKHERI